MNQTLTLNDVLPEKTQLNIDHSFLRYAPIETPDVGATRIDGPSITPGQTLTILILRIPSVLLTCCQPLKTLWAYHLTRKDCTFAI